MQERQLTIKNRLGLHARPAARFIKAASEFNSKIKILKDEQEVDGKSIMGLMTLAAGKGCKITLITEGEDEQEAIKSLSFLIEGGFGEEIV